MASDAKIQSVQGPLTYFPGKCIFLTGATGFLGKVLLEKFLREVSSIKCIYILVRPCPKSGKSPHQRIIDEVINSPLFEILRRRYNDLEQFVFSKVKIIEGDLDREGFGLSERDIQKLIFNVNIVINAAAASDWHENLEIAVKRNVNAVIQLMTLARRMHHLDLFLQVSSAYVSCRSGTGVEVEERIYPLGFDVDEAVHELTHMKAAKMEKNSKKLLHGFTNSHAFTKALAEILMIQNKETLPIAIVRPAILGSTYREPFPGWVDSLSVAGSLFAYTGLGMVHFVPGNPDHIVDIVPCDYAANMIIVASAILASDSKQVSQYADVPIYHISSSHNPIKWGYVAQTVTHYWQKSPLHKALAPSSVKMIKNHTLYQTQFFLKYKVPAKMYSSMARILRSDFHKLQASKMKDAVDKCQKLNESLFHFVDNEWLFDTSNADRLRELLDSLPPLSTLPPPPSITFDDRFEQTIQGQKRFSENGTSEHHISSPLPNFDHLPSIVLDNPSNSGIFSSSNIPPFSGLDHNFLATSELVMGESDKFNFDFNTVDWHSFLHYYCWGLRRFVLKETHIPPPSIRELKHGRQLSRDLDGRYNSKPWMRDFVFSYNASKNVAYPSVRQQRELNAQVLASPSVTAAIHQVSQQKSIPEAVLQVKAQEIMDRMATMQQKVYLKVLSWFFRKIWRHIYEQVDVNENVLMKLFEQAKKGSIVLIPSHKSYIDFLIMSYILFAYDFPAPMIAAGEDFLNMSFVSNLLRFGGAFFLRRTFRGDTLYNAIFTEYVQRLSIMGFPIEFFVEGTRSRSGKLLQPKLGMVNMLTDTYFNKQVSEMTFFPIHINYERVMEDAAYTREWMGAKKKAENLENLLQASSILKQTWGRISLKFSTPIILSSYSERCGRQLHKDSFNPFENQDDRREVNIALAHQIVYDINSMTVWSPLAIVGSIMLNYRSCGIKYNKLLNIAEWIIKDILAREEGCEEWIIEHPSDEIATKAVNDFGEYIVNRRNILKVASQDASLVLAFYRNRLIHLFIRDAYILSTFLALGGLQKSSEDNNGMYQSIPVNNLLNAAEFLALIINKEFVYKVHPEESEYLRNTLNLLVDKCWLQFDPLDPSKVKLGTNENALEAVFYLSSLITSFIDSYWISLVVLVSTMPSLMQRSVFSQRVHECADKFMDTHLLTQESCSRETLNNATSALFRLGLTKGQNFGEIMSVATPYDTDPNQLKNYLLRLGELRTSHIIATCTTSNGCIGVKTPQKLTLDDVESWIASVPQPSKL